MTTAIRRSVDGEVLEEVEVPARAAALCLEPHPEGGWYRRTWASGAAVTTDAGTRAAATLILFLLPPGEASAWHRVVSDELWLWHGPDPLRLQVGRDAEPVLLDAEHPQVLVPGGQWQRTLPSSGEALVSCVVSPGFDFADFELEG